MSFSIKYARMMDMPDGKLPGFYSQVVKALGAKAHLFDRDKELLITNTDTEALAVEEVLQSYKIPFEPMTLYLLPEDAKVHAHLDDVGFTSRFENTYLYRELVIPFRFMDNPSAEQAQAHLQMCESLTATLGEQEEAVYFCSRSQKELIEGIAKAYQCPIEFLDVVL